LREQRNCRCSKAKFKKLKMPIVNIKIKGYGLDLYREMSQSIAFWVSVAENIFKRFYTNFVKKMSDRQKKN